MIALVNSVCDCGDSCGIADDPDIRSAIDECTVILRSLTEGADYTVYARIKAVGADETAEKWNARK